MVGRLHRPRSGGSMRISVCLLATLFISTGCTQDERVSEDGALVADPSLDTGETCDATFTARGAAVQIVAPGGASFGGDGYGGGGSQPTCICDQCDDCNSTFKLCMVSNYLTACNPGIPGGTPPDWR